MNWCILTPVLVGAICTSLGYLLGKLLNGNNHDDCNDRITILENNIIECQKAKARLDTKVKSLKLSDTNGASSFASQSVRIPFDGATAKVVFGKTIKENDLTIVEGVGPKIQELFHNHFIKTWKALSECPVDKCQQVLNSGGEHFAIHNPRTWPEQAKMAYEGQWDALLKWQDELDGGK